MQNEACVCVGERGRGRAMPPCAGSLGRAGRGDGASRLGVVTLLDWPSKLSVVSSPTVHQLIGAPGSGGTRVRWQDVAWHHCRRVVRYGLVPEVETASEGPGVWGKKVVLILTESLLDPKGQGETIFCLFGFFWGGRGGGKVDGVGG